MYKLEVVNGRVGTMLKKPDGTKFHYELNKNVVQHMINNGELVPSDESFYPICINHEWYFRGKEVKK